MKRLILSSLLLSLLFSCSGASLRAPAKAHANGNACAQKQQSRMMWKEENRRFESMKPVHRLERHQSRQALF